MKLKYLSIILILLFSAILIDMSACSKSKMKKNKLTSKSHKLYREIIQSLKPKTQTTMNHSSRTKNLMKEKVRSLSTSFLETNTNKENQANGSSQWFDSNPLNQNIQAGAPGFNSRTGEFEQQGGIPGTFNFQLACPLLKKFMEKSFILKDGQSECLDNICNNTQSFYSMINRFWNNLYTFYVSERYTKDLDSQNKKFKNLIGNIEAMFKINSSFTTFANGKSISCNGILDFDLNTLNKIQMVTILSQPAYYGSFNYIGKDAEKFIDSEFSIYRQTLPPGSFQKLNEESRKNSKILKNMLSNID